MFASTIMLLTTLFHIDNELNSTKKNPGLQLILQIQICILNQCLCQSGCKALRNTLLKNVMDDFTALYLVH